MAYYRVEWIFLDKVMGKKVFANSWINLIMNCITSSRFSILINGELKESIISQSGLRQGCPLSSYLLLFWSKALSSLVHKAQESQLVNGLKVNLRSPSMSHLLFADDFLLFFRASKDEGEAIKSILH